MMLGNATQRAIGALFHSHTYEHEEGEAGAGRPGLTIAINRQAGARGAEIARLVGEKLNWPVFDRELVQRIAEQTGVRARLLENLDERRVHWLREVIESFTSRPTVQTTTYLRHLVEVIASLSARGRCVIVGRGAAMLLPLATTLRVRVVAPLEDRIASVRQTQSLSRDAALRWIEHTDRERTLFYKEHFNKDVNDPLNHDLILNSGRFSPAECTDLIIEALKQMQQRVVA
jgi:cytidylate kinase